MPEIIKEIGVLKNGEFTTTVIGTDTDRVDIDAVLAETLNTYNMSADDLSGVLGLTAEELSKRVIVGEEISPDIEDVVIDADTLGGQLPSYYAKKDSIWNIIYPVGSIYMSVNSTDPSILFGGEWERIKDTFLLSAGDTYEAGSVGGESEHTLSVDEMPSHSHPVSGYQNNGNSSWIAVLNVASWQTDEGDTMAIGFANSTGGSQPHNNMPPYLTVYMWKRIA